MATFSAGDVVTLKSSSVPRMTVSKVDSSGNVTCHWSNNGKIEEKTFLEEELQLYTPPAIGTIDRRSSNRPK